MGERALSVMKRHLEVLAGPLTILSLVDAKLPDNVREAVGRKLLALKDEWDVGSMPISRASAPPDIISQDGVMDEDWYEVL